MKPPPVEAYARSLSAETVASVRAASAQKVTARSQALMSAFADPEAARDEASRIKSFVLDNLDQLLEQFVVKCRANGVTVHLAADSDEANRLIIQLCRAAAPEGGTVVKAKSMATEEIHLNRHLEESGFHTVETDLGEYVVQIDGDAPSHIVTPIIHKNRREIARSFEREGLGSYTEDPAELTMQARTKLRRYFQSAKIGISGVNFGIAETGRIVLVENEGNNRLSTTAPDVHIAVMGIEKLLPTEADLPLFLTLLANSATGQRLTTYVHLISGPRRAEEPDGPRELHLVLLDNGRRRVLASPYRDVLKCIRCGACLNVCPVYRQASGHAYGHVYSGPIGAVLTPALLGVEKAGHLAKASSLCGACEEVCPVRIPLPDMLLQLRDEAKRAGAVKDPAPWGLYATGAIHPTLWRTGLKLLPIAKALPHPMKSGWKEFHDLPQKRGSNFRKWWAENQATKPTPASPSTSVEAESIPFRPQMSADLWSQFKANLESLGGEIRDLRDLDLAGKACFVDDDVPGFSDMVRTTDPWQADVGITLADFAIAETGSIVISAGQARHRLASLTPPTHIVLAQEIVPSLSDALARLTDRTSVIITGTSRTADIEGVLVRGVHGPGEVIVVRVGDDGVDALNA